MKETAWPDGFSRDTPRSYFSGNPEFCLVYTVEDCMVAPQWVRREPDLNRFFDLFLKKIKVIGGKLQNHPTDLDIILAVLEFLDFIENHADNFKKHYRSSTTVITMVMVSLYKLSDKIKNKNMEIVSDAGWPLFDLLGKLENTEDTALPPFSVFHMLMQPKIIDELVTQMRSVLHQMHDTEAETLGLSVPKKHVLFQADPLLCSRIAELQNEIEKSITAGDLKHADELSKQLKNIIKDKNLKANFEDTHFFCVTVNNFYSLYRLREIIKSALALGELNSADKKAAFLQCLIKLGEYMCHRKLSNRFREGFPGISWEGYQIIRDVLCHPENGENVEITKRLLEGNLDSSGLSLNALQSELTDLDKALEKVMKVRFSDSNNLFYGDYREKYHVQPVTICSEAEKLLFLENLKSDDAGVVEEWRKILAGEQLFPRDSKVIRRGVELKRAVFVAPDLNAPIRQRLEDIVNVLSEETPPEDIAFLKAKLDLSICPDKIVRKLGVDKLFAGEKAALRRSFPKPFFGAHTVKHAIGVELIGRVEDVRDRGVRFLYPRQNKVFEQTPLFLADPSRWSTLMKDEAVCPTVDEYCQVCDLMVSDQRVLEEVAENTVKFDFSLELNDIFEKIKGQFEKRLRHRWKSRMFASELNEFLEILHKNSTIEKRWFKVLSGESEYPSQKEFQEDLEIVDAQSHDDALQFTNLTRLLKPIIAELPRASALKSMFQAGYKEKDERKDLGPLSSVQKKQICAIGIHEIENMSAIMTEELYGEDFFKEKVIGGIVNPLFDAAVHIKAETNPSFKAFLRRRQRVMGSINEQVRANPGKVFRRPLEHIAEMYKSMVVPSDIDEEIEREVLAETHAGVKQAFKDNHEFELPRRIKDKAEFRLAVEFHLGRCLSLLKIIIKFANPKDAEFLVENYLVLKKYRNDLVHDDYIAESLGRDLKETTGFLAKLVDVIKGNLRAILKSIDSGEENHDMKLFGRAGVEGEPELESAMKEDDKEEASELKLFSEEDSEKVKLPEKLRAAEMKHARRGDFFPPPPIEMPPEEVILNKLKEVTGKTDWVFYKKREYYFLCEKKGISLVAIKSELEKMGIKSKINKKRLEVYFNQAQVLLDRTNKKPPMGGSKNLKKQ